MVFTARAALAAITRGFDTRKSWATLRRPDGYLARRSVMSFDVKRATIECLDGELWVTGPGLGDCVLAPGQRAEVVHPGRVVVQALVPSRVFVSRG